ncbi:cupin domain-containing protein [Schaalia georgiae]|uniref:Cupin domain protein n=1 Tax=Schaalia georgiae F0490 TaxID=1125717 RepID=J1HZA4_9ACTO|nr:cupin domain-containing protein [Schaalia georgiae]EJF51700.1 cupin domain protein [Schaalia georgiae F0490]RRR37513.1 cupin domain-containing protein [Schaalia georgiae]
MSLSADSSTDRVVPVMTDLQDVAAMVAVNEGATVSRTVMHAEGVRLVLFSFDTDEYLSEHTAAMPVLLFALEGALEIEADGRVVVLKPGDVIHFGTRLPHAVRALEPSKLALYMLDKREKPQQ